MTWRATVARRALGARMRRNGRRGTRPPADAPGSRCSTSCASPSRAPRRRSSWRSRARPTRSVSRSRTCPRSQARRRAFPRSPGERQTRRAFSFLFTTGRPMVVGVTRKRWAGGIKQHTTSARGAPGAHRAVERVVCAARRARHVALHAEEAVLAPVLPPRVAHLRFPEDGANEPEPRSASRACSPVRPRCPRATPRCPRVTNGRARGLPRSAERPFPSRRPRAVGAASHQPTSLAAAAPLATGSIGRAPSAPASTARRSSRRRPSRRPRWRACTTRREVEK